MLNKKEFNRLMVNVTKKADKLPEWTKEYFEVHFGTVILKGENKMANFYIPSTDERIAVELVQTDWDDESVVGLYVGGALILNLTDEGIQLFQQDEDETESSLKLDRNGYPVIIKE